MKNYLAVGMLFLAIGIVRLQRDLFQDARLWPIALLLSGLLLMLVATRYSRIRMELARLFARGSRV